MGERIELVSDNDWRSHEEMVEICDNNDTNDGLYKVMYNNGEYYTLELICGRRIKSVNNLWDSLRKVFNLLRTSININER